MLSDGQLCLEETHVIGQHGVPLQLGTLENKLLQFTLHQNTGLNSQL